MKLASIPSGSRDGALVVVSRDNQTAILVTHIAPHLQYALDHWQDCEPELQKVYDQLNHHQLQGTLSVATQKFLSPLPRAYAWMDGSAFLQHVKLVRKARGAALPATLETDPLIYQGGSDIFLAPTDDIPQIDPSHGTDFEGEFVVITGDIPLAADIETCGKAIRLVGICNDVSLRGLIPNELEKGFGFFVSKPSSAFAPFFVTPDELGEAWQDGRVHLDLIVKYNEQVFGRANGGEMFFSFPRLLQHVVQTRALAAGAILGSGTVANEDESRGSSCLAEKRMLEKIRTGDFQTSFMQVGDRIEIECFGKDGVSLFGKIDQKVVKAP